VVANPRPSPTGGPGSGRGAVPGPTIRPPDPAAVARVVAAALAEDLVLGDPTTDGLFDAEMRCEAALLVKERGVVAGLPIAAAVFTALDPRSVTGLNVLDGTRIGGPPFEVAHISGTVRAVLAGERTALNLVGRLSGIATLAARCVEELAGTGATLLDTRKTTAGLRELEKYAVRCGGATNHRLNLGEAMLVKDSHRRLAGGVRPAAERLRKAHPELSLEVEAETMDEVREALACGVDRILLDNMGPAMLREAVALCRGRAKTEASGGITLANLREVGQTGVDFVSLGALTHSARSLDVSLEILVPGSEK
jgi:nicotinate-nucleotide pyrophosphorylase (carboxylating)